MKKAMMGLLIVMISFCLSCSQGNACKSNEECGSCQTCDKGSCIQKDDESCKPVCVKGDVGCPIDAPCNSNDDCNQVSGVLFSCARDTSKCVQVKPLSVTPKKWANPIYGQTDYNIEFKATGGYPPYQWGFGITCSSNVATHWLDMKPASSDSGNSWLTNRVENNVILAPRKVVDSSKGCTITVTALDNTIKGTDSSRPDNIGGQSSQPFIVEESGCIDNDGYCPSICHFFNDNDCPCSYAYTADCSRCVTGALGTYPYCFLPKSSDYCLSSQCFFVTPTEQASCADSSTTIDCPGGSNPPTCEHSTGLPDDLTKINYEITGLGIDPVTGTIPYLSTPLMAGFDENDVPVGSGYTVRLFTPAGASKSCSASYSLDIVSGRSTVLYVILICKDILPFCGQDAQYPDRERNFTCYNADGSKQTPCAASASNNEVVTDYLTGLMWQRNVTTSSARYAWQDPNDATNFPAANYCESLNTNSYGGYNNGWRLPTTFELQSLINHNMSAGIAATIDATAFPDTPQYYFWSSSVDNSYNTYFVDFWTGKVNSQGFPTSIEFYCYARCVRGGPNVQGGGNDSDRFVVSGTSEPVVTDMITQLVWQKEYTTGNWQQALSHCESSTYGGYSDWRLPNIRELASLENISKWPMSDFPDNFPFIYFWSSTDMIVQDRISAWTATFGIGTIYQMVKTDSLSVRCVRGGP